MHEKKNRTLLEIYRCYGLYYLCLFLFFVGICVGEMKCVCVCLLRRALHDALPFSVAPELEVARLRPGLFQPTECVLRYYRQFFSRLTEEKQRYCAPTTARTFEFSLVCGISLLPQGRFPFWPRSV